MKRKGILKREDIADYLKQEKDIDRAIHLAAKDLEISEETVKQRFTIYLKNLKN